MTEMADTVFLFDVELADVENHFPARHYVMIDGKLRIRHAIERARGDRVTTVFPQQGRYATDRTVLAEFPPADLTVDHIGDLPEHDLAALAKR